MTMLMLVDLETSGVDPAKDHTVEVAACLYDPARGIPVAIKSALVRAESNAAEPINRIPADALREEYCVQPAVVRGLLRGMEALACGPVIYVAHNAAFDRQWLPGVGERWICSCADATWPRVPGETGSLTSIALAYDVGVVRAHRAVEDVLTLAAVLTRVHEVECGLEKWLARALEPKRELTANPPIEQNQIVKDAGFRWDRERRVWHRMVRESQLDDFVKSLPFKVQGQPQAA